MSTPTKVAISFGLPRISDVIIEVSDTTGQRVRLLVTGTHSAGEYTVEWDGRTDGGHIASDGVYRVRLTANAAGGRTFIQSRLITLQRHH
ncbi:MAG: hypothetical protein MUE60_07645 [Candidatus Eisenbacteria bacterium]|nr:hypothetical protein [Candidatus Eisenbacteria bacterium]